MPRSITSVSPAPVVKALPAAGASNTSASIDLGAAKPGDSLETVVLRLQVPALPSLADTKKVTIKFQDSADDSTFADIPELANVVLTGAGGTGAAAKEVKLRLPPSVRRYVAVNQAVEAAGGDNTGVSTTLDLLF